MRIEDRKSLSSIFYPLSSQSNGGYVCYNGVLMENWHADMARDAGDEAMPTAPAVAASRGVTRAWSTWSPALVALLLGAVALLPRVLGLADFITTDEAYHWIARTERFGEAIAGGRWA